MSLFLVFAGFGCFIVGWAILVIHAFQEHFIWGLVCLVPTLFALLGGQHSEHVTLFWIVCLAPAVFGMFGWRDSKLGVILYSVGWCLIYRGVLLPGLK
jgi:hypothetical protein